MGKIIGNGIKPAVGDPKPDSTVKEMGKIIGNGIKPAVGDPKPDSTVREVSDLATDALRGQFLGALDRVNFLVHK
ncbi:hypothetical protein ACTGJ9_006135 [Bradyrhizobium sp. RDM12]